MPQNVFSPCCYNNENPYHSQQHQRQHHHQRPALPVLVLQLALVLVLVVTAVAGRLGQIASTVIGLGLI